MNLEICSEAVSKYAKKWAKKGNVDKRILRDCKEMVIEGVEKRISYLKQKHINKRKKHTLRNKVHLNSLKYLHDNFVLVPADRMTC